MMPRRNQTAPSGRIVPRPLWLLVSIGLLGLSACGEPPTSRHESNQTIPAAGSPAIPAAVSLQRSPVAAGSYRIEAGNPIPVPLGESALVPPALPQGAIMPANALASEPLEATSEALAPPAHSATEIIVQPGMPMTSTAGMAARPSNSLRR